MELKRKTRGRKSILPNAAKKAQLGQTFLKSHQELKSFRGAAGAR
jgi:hypothetical protein